MSPLFLLTPASPNPDLPCWKSNTRLAFFESDRLSSCCRFHNKDDGDRQLERHLGPQISRQMACTGLELALSCLQQPGRQSLDNLPVYYTPPAIKIIWPICSVSAEAQENIPLWPICITHSANVIKQNVWKAGECSGNNLEKHTKSTFVKEQVSLLSYNEGVLFLKSAV